MDGYGALWHQRRQHVHVEREISPNFGTMAQYRIVPTSRRLVLTLAVPQRRGRHNDVGATRDRVTERPSDRGIEGAV